MKKNTRSSALVVLLSLISCSSGGGSSGATAAATDPANTGDPPAAAAQTFALQGGGTITMNSDGSATLDTGGASTALTPLASAPPNDAVSFAGGQFLAQQSGATPVVLERMGPATGLSASDFGVWNTFNASGALTATNFYAGGQATPPSLLPPAGAAITATYSGSYIADLASAAEYGGTVIPAGPFSGSAQLALDFGAGTVSATFGGLLAGTTTSSSSIDRANGTYTATGGTFSPYAPASYSLSGALYGTPSPGGAPPETAGTIAGTIGATTATSTAAPFTGSFGAHR
jgi:hypothetical protein